MRSKACHSCARHVCRSVMAVSLLHGPCGAQVQEDIQHGHAVVVPDELLASAEQLHVMVLQRAWAPPTGCRRTCCRACWTTPSAPSSPTSGRRARATPCRRAPPCLASPLENLARAQELHATRAVQSMHACGAHPSVTTRSWTCKLTNSSCGIWGATARAAACSHWIWMFL